MLENILERNRQIDAISLVLAIKLLICHSQNNGTFSVPYGTDGTRVKIRYCTVKYGWQAW